MSKAASQFFPHYQEKNILAWKLSNFKMLFTGTDYWQFMLSMCNFKPLEHYLNILYIHKQYQRFLKETQTKSLELLFPVGESK